jgi:hypothetical protein
VWELGSSAFGGGGFAFHLFVRCMLGLECVQTTMLEDSGHSGGRGPYCGGGQSGGKRLMYEDLDAPQSSNWPLLSDSGIGLGSGGPSSGRKRSKRANAYEKNSGYLPKDYTGFAILVAIKYYAHRFMDLLERTFFDNGMDGYVELCKDLCYEFMKSFDESEIYT